MTANDRSQRWNRVLSVALSVSIVAAVVIELSGGFVLEIFSFEVTARTTRAALILFAVLWIVRAAVSGALSSAARSGLRGLAWAAGLLALVGLLNWGGSALVWGRGDGEAPPAPTQALGGLGGSDDWNVLLISLDTLRADHLGCYGYRRDTSPTIDGLAAEGALFDNQIAAAPDTLVSHASMLTSTDPTVHGARMYPPQPVSESAVTLAEVLRDQGFATAAITGGGQLDRTFNLTQGFDLYRDKWSRQGSRLRRQRKRAVKWLANHKQDRWFLFFHTYQIHTSYRAHEGISDRFTRNYTGSLPPEISQRLVHRINQGRLPIDDADLEYIVALYDGEIAFTDLHLKRMFDALRSMGLWENTLVIVTSDHGEEFGEHGKVATHSHSLYDELLKVPLVIRAPGHFQGVRVNTQTRGIDLAPTVLDLLGIEVPDSMQGVSLRPLMDGSWAGPGLPAVSERTAGRGLLSWRTERAKLLYPKAYVGTGGLLGRLGFSGSEYYADVEPYRALYMLDEDPGETEDAYSHRTWLGRALLGDMAASHRRNLGLAPPEVAAEVDDDLRGELEALGYVQ